ncbi:VOC family protein [Pararhodobacter oceanensis]|uniref:Glyoxalase n=1 Tax=Pararhodobacter oceanensis TaxID=2172121 RepID=A0A2T8HRQ5_9RHOB|nr:VOC family protein [Pararhodobacter oceanensis]PVH28095.1 glyoxalase [Pararhodobacter oceanensis]
MLPQSIHHVAYRCKDAKETVDFYEKALGMSYTFAVAEDENPTTGESAPFMHIFFQLPDGSHVAFFELPEENEMGRDPNTPEWVQHLAMDVGSLDDLNTAKSRLEAMGVEVVGPTDHKICHSIYFFDPNGHRLELAYRTLSDELAKKLHDISAPMLEEWTKTKRAPRHLMAKLAE